MFAIAVAAAIMIIFALPYVNNFLKRKRFIGSLKRICALRMYDIKVFGGARLYFVNTAAPYDISINTGKLIIRIKLWNEWHRDCTLIFRSDGQVIRRKKISDVFSEGEHRTHKIYQKKTGKIYFDREKAPKGKELLSFFVTDTNDMTIFATDAKGVIRLSYGEKLYGMTLITASSFISKIKPRG